MLRRETINFTSFERYKSRVFSEVALNLWTQITRLRDHFVLWASGISTNSDLYRFDSTWRQDAAPLATSFSVFNVASIIESFGGTMDEQPVESTLFFLFFCRR